MRNRFDVGQYCDTCGAKIYYDYWGHAIKCAKHKQQQEAAQRAAENGRRAIRKLTKQD